MARKGPIARRELPPDPVYDSVLVTQLVNKVLTCGKRTLAENIVYDAFDMISKKSRRSPVEILEIAVENVRPALEVRSRRVGGSTYQVPMDVRPRRQMILTIRWLVTYSRDRREHTMAERLANELLDAANGEGASVRRREELHRMAESNKAFAHYRW